MQRFFKIILFISLIVSVSCKQDAKEQPEPTPEPKTVSVKGTEVHYASDSTQLKGYIAYDENTSEKRPGILIVHEWWGHNAYVRERADMLAELGYTALAIDMYGDGKQANHPDDAGKFAQAVFKNLDEAQNRFNAAIDVLKAHQSVDDDKLAAIGYCFGGSVVLTMANLGADLDAVAAFHSGVTLPEMPNDKLKARVLVCNGGADPFIGEEGVAIFKSAMDSIGAKYEYISYPGVLHSYTSKYADENGEKFSLPLKYDADADAKSWQSLQDMFKDVF